MSLGSLQSNSKGFPGGDYFSMFLLPIVSAVRLLKNKIKTSPKADSVNTVVFFFINILITSNSYSR